MTRGGTKRKIEIEKRETKQQRSVTCSKRRKTVFSKAADICLNGGANMAVFVTSPVEGSDVVYSFSGYSSASEIAHCYLNGKSPPPITIPESNFGFLSEDPVDLYRNCDDLSELDSIEDRYLRMLSDLVACIDRKRRLHQNQDKPCPVSLSFDQNPSSQSICFDDQNHISEETPFLCFDQNPTFECPESFCFDQNPTLEDKPLFTEESFGFDQNLSYEDLSFTQSFGFDQIPQEEAPDMKFGELNAVADFEMDQDHVEALMKTFGALDSLCPSFSNHNLQQLAPSDINLCGGIPFESSVLYHHHNMFQHYPGSYVA